MPRARRDRNCCRTVLPVRVYGEIFPESSSPQKNPPSCCPTGRPSGRRSRAWRWEEPVLRSVRWIATWDDSQVIRAGKTENLPSCPAWASSRARSRRENPPPARSDRACRRACAEPGNQTSSTSSRNTVSAAAAASGSRRGTCRPRALDLLASARGAAAGGLPFTTPARGACPRKRARSYGDLHALPPPSRPSAATPSNSARTIDPAGPPPSTPIVRKTSGCRSPTPSWRKLANDGQRFGDMCAHADLRVEHVAHDSVAVDDDVTRSSAGPAPCPRRKAWTLPADR